MHHVPGTLNKGKLKAADAGAPPLELLDLPGEILSQIAAYLDLDEVIAFLSLHSALHNLARSHLTPLRPIIYRLLRRGPPYPPALAVLPSLHHLVGHDDGKLFLDVLVRAPPRWILERLEVGRWRDHVWQEAYARRFLPSWVRYKSSEDSWRAAFIRVVGRLEHRAVGCAHHESWTRFITLRRNRSAAINRIYTRTFDPNEIFDEYKHQANMADYPTQVRVLVHLQDVRLIVLGILSDRPTYAANSNAHLALHPPLLRHLSSVYHRPRREKVVMATTPTSPRESVAPAMVPMLPTPSSTPSVTAPVPIVPETTATTAPVPASPASLPTIVSGIGNWVSRRRRTSGDSNAGDGAGSSAFNPLTLVRTRSRGDDDRDRVMRRSSWTAFARTRTGSTSGPSAQQLPPVPSTSSSESSSTQVSPQPDFAPVFASPVMPPIPLLPPLPEDKTMTPASPTVAPSHSSSPSESPSPASSPSPPLTRRHRLPYPPLTHPTPAYSHSLYPNFTPCDGPRTLPSTTRPDPLVPALLVTEGVVPRVHDFREDHLEVEDDAAAVGPGWSTLDATWGADGRRMAEWDDDTGIRRRWVGPMIILAQIFPSTRAEAVPMGVARDSLTEGAQPDADLGPRGTYASLGWEDVDALLPWLEISGAGAFHNARTSGMGFEPDLEL